MHFCLRMIFSDFMTIAVPAHFLRRICGEFLKRWHKCMQRHKGPRVSSGYFKKFLCSIQNHIWKKVHKLSTLTKGEKGNRAYAGVSSKHLQREWFRIGNAFKKKCKISKRSRSFLTRQEWNKKAAVAILIINVKTLKSLREPKIFFHHPEAIVSYVHHAKLFVPSI